MENQELLRRAEDLSRRSYNQYIVTHTGFLTPAQCALLESSHSLPHMLLYGGAEGCERKAAFFLPAYVTPEAFQPADYISAFLSVSKFTSPGHRDYLGALLSLGLERRCVGDIYVSGDTARFFCLSSVAEHIAQNLDKAGGGGVQLTPIPLSGITVPEKARCPISFTIQSLRLDSVTASIFGLSRNAAREMILSGRLTLNYSICQKPDRAVGAGDVLSARGHGKVEITEVGGRTRKGRISVTAGKYL